MVAFKNSKFPPGGSGGGGAGIQSVTGPSVDNTDPQNPIIETPADNSTDGNIVLKGSTTFENSALSEDATTVTSTKPITAPSIMVDVGTINLGNAISMSVGGENIYYKDGVDGSIHGSVFQDVGDILPKARVRGAFNDAIIRQPLKTDNLINPMFTLTPPDNEQILAFTIESATAQTNVIVKAFKSGVEFYKQNVGSIPADVEHQIDLLVGSGVPVDVFGSTSYDIEVTSLDGDVTLKGINAGTIPFYAVTYYEFEFQDLVTANLPINQEILIEQSSPDSSQEPSALDTPLRINFGAAFGTGLDPVEMDATGLFTVNESGTYFPTPCFHYGRTSSAGEVELYGYLEVDGIPQGTSTWARLDDDNTALPFNATPLPLALTAGQTFAYYIVRDSSLGGINDGGLFLGTPASAIPDAPSAKIIISRLVGNAASILSSGDVVGPGSSNQNEVATFANLTGKELAASSDISMANGVIERITSGEDIWIKVDASNENIFVGRHIDGAGVPSLTNTTMLVTASATNALAMVTTGNNSQSIDFVKSGVFRGKLSNNRDRNSIAIENANGKRLEILPNDTATFLVDKIGIGRDASASDVVAAFADNMGIFRMPRATTAQRDAYTTGSPAGINWNLDTAIEETWDGINWYQSGGKPEGCIISAFQNTQPTLIIALDSYVRARLGGGQTITNQKNFTLGTDGAIYSGNLYRGVVTITFDYHIPPSLLDTKGYAFVIARDGSAFTNSLHENNNVLNSGQYIQGTCTTLMELATGAEVTLRVKQIVGTLEDDITFRNVSITFS